jgi:hypothetical protein
MYVFDYQTATALIAELSPTVIEYDYPACLVILDGTAWLVRCKV